METPFEKQKLPSGYAYTRPRRRNALSSYPTPVVRVRRADHLRYSSEPMVICATTTVYDEIGHPSMLIQALTIGAWLGQIIDAGTALLISVGLGWLLLRTRHRP